VVIEIEFYTVFWREMLAFRRTFYKFFASRLVSPLLYLVAFGWGLGRGIRLNGYNYLDFVVPGIIALSAMSTSFNAVGFSLNMSRLYYKTLEEYLLAPISSTALVLGITLGGTVRGLVASLIILVLAFLFGSSMLLNPWFFVIIILTSFLFSALGVVAAMTINSHEDMSNFSTFVILPMSFLSGTFFSPEHLHRLVTYIINVLPLTHASYALRALAQRGELLPFSLVVLVAYSLLLFVAAVVIVKRAR